MINYKNRKGNVCIDAPAITPELMLNLSIQLLQEYKDSGEHEDVPSVNEKGEKVIKRVISKYYDSTLYDLSRKAEKALEWMLLHDIQEAVSVFGFYGSAINDLDLPGPGGMFEVPRGVRVYSTHPKVTRKGALSKRRQRVCVHAVYSGYYVDKEWRSGGIRWVGEGGYWRWVEIDDLLRLRAEEGERADA